VATGNGLAIVGGGLSTARAIKAYREAGGDEAITVFSRDTAIPYHRPPLSKRFLRGEAEAEDTLVEPESFYETNACELRLETGVSSLDLRDRALVLEDGGRHPFDKLLIASGAWPNRLDVPGSNLEGVRTLRTLDDSGWIRDAARDALQAVVVSAGFIGMEVAASLVQLGLEVTMIHRGKGLFEILRARTVAQYLADLYGHRGVELVLGDEVASFGGRSRLDAVETKRGRVAQAELAIVGIGVTPATRWLEGSGLQLNDGVVVNERFETGAESVWAIGDVARFYDPVFDRQRRIEHWSNANYMGTEVGRLMAGADGGYDRVSTFFTEIFGITMKVLGDVDEIDEIVFRGALEDGAAIGFYLRGEQLDGCLVVGQDEETENRLIELIRARVTVHDASRLADENMSFEEVFVSRRD
jgi:NADPH-dependent 2,4-dienoyl-CoA reductase/sulfur reductase-like enzyme